MKLVAFAGFVLLSLPVLAQVAPAVAPVTSSESPEIRELQKVEDAWAGALNQRDQYGLELVLSPLFVNVSAAGEIATRDQTLVSLINEADKNAVTDLHVVTVRMLGDVAVANGIYNYTHRVNGAQVVEKGVFTHVFQRLRGNWVCLNAQRTLLQTEAPSKAPKPKAKSDAELPFHIPLFSRSSGAKSGDSSKPNQ